MTDFSFKEYFAYWRIHLVLFGMFLCVLVIIWKVANLHITERDFLQNQGDRRTIRTVPLVANRGLITDRNGEPLAVSTPVQSIWVDPSKISDDPEDIEALAKNLDALFTDGHGLLREHSLIFPELGISPTSQKSLTSYLK